MYIFFPTNNVENIKIHLYYSTRLQYAVLYCYALQLQKIHNMVLPTAIGKVQQLAASMGMIDSPYIFKEKRFKVCEQVDEHDKLVPTKGLPRRVWPRAQKDVSGEYYSPIFTIMQLMSDSVIPHWVSCK